MYKIALIDDDQFALDGMRKMIAWEALGAEWAGEGIDGEQGLELIRRTKPDIVVTDIYMPVMNGLEMLETLQAERAGCKVIILSGYSDFEYARQALRLHVSDYLSKPISRHSLNEALEQSIRQLDEEKQKQREVAELSRKVSVYEPLVEAEWLKSLLTGANPGGLDAADLIRQGSAVRPGCSHAVLGIEITPSGRFASLTDWSLFRYAIGNIIREILQQDWDRSWFAELHSYYFAVLLPVQAELPDQAFRTQAGRLGRRLASAVEACLKLNVRIGLGRRKERWQDIHVSLEEAFYALYAKRAEASAEADAPLYVFDESAASPAGGRALESPYRFYAQLSQEIRIGNAEEAMRIVCDFFDTLQSPDADPLPPRDVHRLGIELWTVIGYVLYDIGILADELFPKDRVEREIRLLADQNGLRDWLSDKIVRLHKQHCKSKAKHKQAIDYTLQYIRDHYHEELSITDLGSKVYMSPYYLSQIFKKATGESFTHYLNRVRMEKAKEMLAEGRLMIYEIAERVGCKNVSYFCTLFKKYTGVNPSEFVR
ncbi:response regulator transcription factor [Paenibacillus humicola]|uniref:response regulator transcription factor n=1 Tax=Paenibacillus humicola TaxID=3110540 RepID=UPI00237AEF13|nr:response regulator transcription factor [Paenibacillus humicola]